MVARTACRQAVGAGDQLMATSPNVFALLAGGRGVQAGVVAARLRMSVRQVSRHRALPGPWQLSSNGLVSFALIGGRGSSHVPTGRSPMGSSRWRSSQSHGSVDQRRRLPTGPRPPRSRSRARSSTVRGPVGASLEATRASGGVCPKRETGGRRCWLAAKAALEAGRAEAAGRRFDAAAPAAARLAPGQGQLLLLIDQIRAALRLCARRGSTPWAIPRRASAWPWSRSGGYGRGELAPFSDIDLLFLLPYKMTPRQRAGGRGLLYLLWDLGLKVGQAVRSLDECMRLAKADMTIRTSLLESASWGRPGALPRSCASASGARSSAARAIRFIEAKLAERDAIHRPPGRSRYALEPNIKEGKGGLRDLHTLFWIAKNHYHGRGHRRAWSTLGSSRRRGCAASRRRRTSSGPCAATCTTSPGGRGAPDLRPAEGHRAAHGLHRPRRAARRRALHEALLPDRQGRRRPDAGPLRRARDARSKRALALREGAEPDRRPAPSSGGFRAEGDRA